LTTVGPKALARLRRAFKVIAAVWLCGGLMCASAISAQDAPLASPEAAFTPSTAPPRAAAAPIDSPASAAAPESGPASSVPAAVATAASLAVPADRPKVQGAAGAADDRRPDPFAFSSSKGPIDIKSDSASLDYKGKIILFRGNVHAVQSATDLVCDVLQVSYGKDFNDIRLVTADQNVKITQGGRWATSDHAVLDQVARTIVMTGHPVVHEGPDQVTGTKITVYLDTQNSVVESARAVIFPHQQQTRDNNNQANGGDHSVGQKD
jgi:lipopolysaccharide transport protein LptA